MSEVLAGWCVGGMLGINWCRPVLLGASVKSVGYEGKELMTVCPV